MTSAFRQDSSFESMDLESYQVTPHTVLGGFLFHAKFPQRAHSVFPVCLFNNWAARSHTSLAFVHCWLKSLSQQLM